MEKKFKSLRQLETKRHFLSFNIAGFTYHDGCEVFDQLKIGSPLRLIREEDNPHDSNAIAVFFGDTWLGYVPRLKNSDLALFMDMGYEDLFVARIQQLNPQAHPEQQVGAVVYVKKAKKSNS